MEVGGGLGVDVEKTNVSSSHFLLLDSKDDFSLERIRIVTIVASSRHRLAVRRNQQLEIKTSKTDLRPAIGLCHLPV